MKIVLASKSPRRISLLRSIGISFDVIDSKIDEESFVKQEPSNYVKTLAYEKANAVANILNKPAVIIGSDTVVVLNNRIIEKPIDDQDAYRILQSLSGNSHFVYTGLSIIDTYHNKVYNEFETTKVYIRTLTPYEIKSYIATKEPMDKAGAYGIQGIGSIIVNKIEGDYYSVMGFPIAKFYNGLEYLGYNLFDIMNKDSQYI